jgi:hypothetical protein
VYNSNSSSLVTWSNGFVFRFVVSRFVYGYSWTSCTLDLNGFGSYTLLFGQKVGSIKYISILLIRSHLSLEPHLATVYAIDHLQMPNETRHFWPLYDAHAPHSKYNKVQSAGYKDLNIIFMLSWMREKRSWF